MSNQPETDHATKRKLLDVASAIFAQMGFRKATVREICSRAGTNIAAIHYHFGNKQALYQEALHYAYRKEKERFPSDFGIAPDAPADQKLFAFIHSFLLRIFHQGEVSDFAKLLMREMIEPTPALRMMVESEFFPLRLHLEGIVRQLTSDALDEDALRRACLSVTGQMLVFHHIRPALQLLYPDMQMDEQELKRIAGHITRFSVAALHEATGGKTA